GVEGLGRKRQRLRVAAQKADAAREVDAAREIDGAAHAPLVEVEADHATAARERLIARRPAEPAAEIEHEIVPTHARGAREFVIGGEAAVMILVEREHVLGLQALERAALLLDARQHIRRRDRVAVVEGENVIGAWLGVAAHRRALKKSRISAAASLSPMPL